MALTGFHHAAPPTPSQKEAKPARYAYHVFCTCIFICNDHLQSETITEMCGGGRGLGVRWAW